MRAVDQATETLRRRLLGGAWAVGERLPAERRLCEELGVSRLTLRAALARLEGEGLVRPRRGDGVRVLDPALHGGVELLPHLVAAGQMELLGPFLQLRRAVAAEAVAAACVRVTASELDTLQALADELAAARGEALMEGNLQFARQVVQLADNLPMLLLFNTVAAVVRARPEILAATLADERGVQASFGAVVALLRAGDADQARTVVRTVLEQLDAAALARLEEEP